MATDRPFISIVAPVYCEEDCLEEFYRRVTDALGAVAPAVDHELIFVDDGSADDSLALMQKLSEGDARVKSVVLSRNFGHQVAITAGIDHAIGDAVVVIDSDLQDPPGVISDMIDAWRNGLKVVYGKRLRREGETVMKLFTAKAFYRLLSWLSDTPVPIDSGDFRLMDRKVVDALRDMRESNRYLRGMVAWVGFSQGAVLYKRDPRYAGVSKFSLRKMVQLALDAIISFSEKPLRLTIRVGMLTTVSALLLAGWMVLSRLTDSSKAFPGYVSLMCAILFLGGMQLISLGLVGAYLGRTYQETKRRPLYVVAERNGFPEE